MQLPGPGVWGEPKNPDGARAVLKRVVELGINLIDTSWYYGPHVSNRLILETLHPYPKGLVIATKLGGSRGDDKSWKPFIKPEQLREGCETDLKSLKLERLDIVHLRWLDAGVPFLEAARRHDRSEEAGKDSSHRYQQHQSRPAATGDGAHRNRRRAKSLQRRLQAKRSSARFLTWKSTDKKRSSTRVKRASSRSCRFFPLAIPSFDGSGPKFKNAALTAAAKNHKATEAQIAIAWLLARSSTMLPIPGTSSVEHLEENWAARKIELSPEELNAIGADRN